MVTEMNYSLNVDNREIKPNYQPNVDIQNAELSIKNIETGIKIEEKDFVNNMKVKNCIGLGNAKFDNKILLNHIKTEIEEDIAMIAELNQHSLKIDSIESNPTYLSSVGLQNAELCIKNEESGIDIEEGDDIKMVEINSTSLKIEKEEINALYENYQEPFAEAAVDYHSNNTFLCDVNSPAGSINNAEELTTSAAPTGTRVYKCDICKYGAKRKTSLQKHMLTHNFPSIYKCKMCSYESKRKKNLNRHMLTHKNPDKCEMCSYETKQKKLMQIHMLKHRNPAATKKFICSICSYGTTQKRYLREHMLTHMNPSEITMYKCDVCSYETKRKQYLAEHILIHKNPTEIAMYKCHICTYEAKKSRYLKRHMVFHKDPSEIPLYKCGKCSFQTKFKFYVKTHELSHEDPSEVAVHKCDMCPTDNVKCENALSGMSQSGVEMYKCEECSYETKQKRNLKRHNLKHKDPSEVPMYKCEFCRYETKRKKCITNHVLKHETSPGKQ